ncbi:MAG: hypothetical protein GYA23_03975 [Methanomicrobiales archaeon]|nr:hypothetical protein [Methanomicrobiales archaeon]
MRWMVLLLALLATGVLCLPVAGIPVAPGVNITGGAPPPPPAITIFASPSQAHIGDTVILNGTVTGINTIAVYLFVTGPDLDPRGVSLENLNIAAGRGLFTTAPVAMKDGTWTYEWDTSIIVGNLKPGTYSVYVVGSPLDRLRSNPQETAVTQVTFQPAVDKEVETPLSPAVPVAALVFAVLLLGAVASRKR